MKLFEFSKNFLTYYLVSFSFEEDMYFFSIDSKYFPVPERKFKISNKKFVV
jgi:hypothetical protein